jgi:hypothetical protein
MRCVLCGVTEVYVFNWAYGSAEAGKVQFQKWMARCKYRALLGAENV